VLIDMAKRHEPVLYITLGKGKEALKQFAAFMKPHQDKPEQILGSFVTCHRPFSVASPKRCRALR